MKSFTQTLKIIILALIIGLGVNYLYAWTGPPGPPPTPNAAPPINVGLVNQIKNAGLGLDTLLVSGISQLIGDTIVGDPASNPNANLIVFDKLGIGGSPAVALDVYPAGGGLGSCSGTFTRINSCSERDGSLFTCDWIPGCNYDSFTGSCTGAPIPQDCSIFTIQSWCGSMIGCTWNIPVATGTSAIFRGDVGIGTPSPGAALDVQGDVIIEGKVGIGTPNPVAKLEVEYTGGHGLVLKEGGNQLRFDATNPLDPEIGSSTGDIWFWYSAPVGWNNLKAGSFQGTTLAGSGLRELCADSSGYIVECAEAAAPFGSVTFTSPLDTWIDWAVPQDVTQIEVEIVGGGGGGAGGARGDPKGGGGGGGGAGEYKKVILTNADGISSGTALQIKIGYGGNGGFGQAHNVTAGRPLSGYDGYDSIVRLREAAELVKAGGGGGGLAPCTGCSTGGGRAWGFGTSGIGGNGAGASGDRTGGGGGGGTGGGTGGGVGGNGGSGTDAGDYDGGAGGSGVGIGGSGGDGSDGGNRSSAVAANGGGIGGGGGGGGGGGKKNASKHSGGSGGPGGSGKVIIRWQ